MNSRVLLSLATCILLIIPASVSADYISPGNVSVKTEKYHPQQTDFESGTYHYDVSWQGIPVAKAQVAVQQDHQGKRKASFHVTASAQTASFIDIFYKLRHTSESVFDAQSLQPRQFASYQVENSKQKMRRVVFREDGNIRSISVKNGKKGNPLEFHSENLTLDPISAAFVARSLPVDLGREFEFDVFNGKHRYLISFSVVGREIVSVNGTGREAFKVVPTVQKLTDSEGEKRFKSATLWVSTSNSREVLKMESKVLIGSVSAELVGFTPEGEAHPRRPGQLHAKLIKDTEAKKAKRMIIR